MVLDVEARSASSRPRPRRRGSLGAGPRWFGVPAALSASSSASKRSKSRLVAALGSAASPSGSSPSARGHVAQGIVRRRCSS